LFWLTDYNIAIVAALLMATLGRAVRDRWRAAGVALLGVVVYTVLVGGDAAVVRAAVMGMALSSAWPWAGRKHFAPAFCYSFIAVSAAACRGRWAEYNARV
jgi:hypothetical protein